MKNHVKIAVAAVSLCTLGSASAFADEATHSFNNVIPPFQQSHYMGAHIRSTSTTSSQIKFSSISDAQLMNVKAENLQNNVQYTELKGIGVNSASQIKNSTPAGKSSRLIITNYDWNVLSPTVIGTEVLH
ncbi:MAG: hypothetical protein RL196_1560 [Actinomycetota bacterium]|jgi:hypothetical protein